MRAAYCAFFHVMVTLLRKKLSWEKRIPYVYSDATQYTMILADISDVNGEECYVYRLDINDPNGTLGTAYAYAYQSGDIYIQGQGGQWVKP